MEIIKQRIIDMNTAIISYNDETSIIGGGVSALLPIKLIGAGPKQRYAGHFSGNGDLDGEVYTLQLLGISASCGSEDWNLHILNKNDINKLDTINEVLSYDEINKSFSDYTFSNLFIQNDDDVEETPYIYAYIENEGLVASGTIEITLTYKPIYI